MSPVVRWHVRPNGERLPLLVDRDSGTPLHTPALYVLTRCRARAAKTIEQRLVGVQVLLMWSESRGIPLEQRVANGALLQGHELDDLWDAAARRVDALSARRGRAGEVAGLVGHSAALSRDNAGNRRRAIRAYLAWLTEQRLFSLGHRQEAQQSYRLARDELLGSLDARTARGRKDGARPRQGLDDCERQSLVEAIRTESEGNPWRDPAVRLRNQLMITLLLDLGVRQGELLALRVEDVDFRQGQLRLVRRPDDPLDPRVQQPVLKTRGRLLDLRVSVLSMLESYVFGVRGMTAEARRHGQLFVSTRTGAPLSASSVVKIFHKLRELPGVPQRITCHVLRHDWNERFSDSMDRNHVPPEKELRLRQYLQGWDREESAATYTHRHTQRAANQALLMMQAQRSAEGGVGDE